MKELNSILKARNIELLLNRIKDILYDKKTDNYLEVGMAIRMLLHETIEVLEIKQNKREHN